MVRWVGRGGGEYVYIFIATYFNVKQKQSKKLTLTLSVVLIINNIDWLDEEWEKSTSRVSFACNNQQ